MRIKFLISALILIFFAPLAHADLYEWVDEEGIIHITDQIEKVPPEYKAKLKVHKSTPASEPERVEESAQRPAMPEGERGEELYGDHTLNWWKEEFARKKDEVQSLEAGVTSKRQYVQIFESGRRFGQVYGTTEIATYKTYKKELPEDEERLIKLKDELEELRRKARIVGVPEYVRQ